MDTVPFYFKPVVPRAADWVADCQSYYDGLTKFIGRKPVLVVIDTMSKAMRGLNENAAPDMELYLGMCEGLIDQLECASLTVAHSGKDESKEIRGSSASGAGFDAVWHVEGVKDSKYVKLTGEDMKDRSNSVAYHFRLKPVTALGISHGQTMVPEAISAEQYDKANKSGAPAVRDDTKEITERILTVFRKFKIRSWDTAFRTTRQLSDHVCEEFLEGSRVKTERPRTSGKQSGQKSMKNSTMDRALTVTENAGSLDCLIAVR